MSARDNILRAYEEILIAGGERAATLDAVAAKAGVSKGGLLYHFRSKEALANGLFERLDALADADLATMATAPEGASVYYVRTSASQGSEFDRCLVAAARLGSGASSAIAAIQRRWLDLITAEVGDDAVAKAILLLGDGIYYNAAVGPDAGGTPAAPQTAEEMEALVEVVARLAGRSLR